MKKGFFIGRTTMDILYYMKGLPVENKKAKTTDYRTSVGGNACNAAITYALLGGKATLITAIGNSSVGKSIKMELEEYNVEVIDLLEDAETLPFICAILINVENESRTIWGGHQPRLEYTKPDEEYILENAGFLLTDNQFPQISVSLLKKARKGVFLLYSMPKDGEKKRKCFLRRRRTLLLQRIVFCQTVETF